MTNSSADEKLSEMKDLYGLEGIGFWWSILEIIALQMDGQNQKCEASYSLSHWAKKIGCHHHKANTLFAKFANIGLVTLKKDDSNGIQKLVVGVPNLIKYRDEYSTRKGGAADVT